MTNLENALVWLYVKTWGKFGEHLIKEKELWNFGAQDLETAIMGLAYPRKRKNQENEKSDRVKALTNLIMEKFEHVMAFHEWSLKIHQENIENLPETIVPQRQQQQGIIKIRHWDPGNYSTFLQNISRISKSICYSYLFQYL